MVLAPYAGGTDFGVLKIPRFSGPARRRLRVAGPIVLIASIAGFLPVWDAQSAKKAGNAIWKSNYKLFASRHFPQIRDARKQVDPPGSGKNFEFESEFVRDLSLLVLKEEPDLERRRGELIAAARAAPKDMPLNPHLFEVNDQLMQRYLEFKSLLRIASIARGVDVEQLERERYEPPK